jgi:hypothetical protein
VNNLVRGYFYPSHQVVMASRPVGGVLSTKLSELLI